MKEIKDVIQNNYRFNNIDLERNFDEEMEDDTFKKIAVKKTSLRNPDFSFCIPEVCLFYNL